MDDKTTAAQGSKRSKLPPELAALIPSGQQVYDAIMGKIEPELVSANLSKLAETHKGETPEQKKARMKRYTNAFQNYDKQYSEWITGVRSRVEAKRDEAFKISEAKAQKKDAAALADLEAHFAEKPIPNHPPSPAVS